MTKRAIIWLSILLIAVLIGWKLFSNKREIEAETGLADISRAFVPVEVVRPSFDTLAHQLEADGIFLPSKEMFVISETQGKVVAVYKNKGEVVREGQVIAQVDDLLLRTELEATQANIAKLRKDRERILRLIEGEAVPKSKVEEIDLGIVAAEAKQTVVRKQLSNTRIKAPMTGIMGLRFIERGSVIGPGIQVAQITNLDKLFLMVKVTEKDVLPLRKGQTVQVKADVYPAGTLPGRITTIGLRADNTFNYDVEIEVPNPKDQPLRGGMHAKAVFSSTTQRKGLTLPRKAIAGSLQDPEVYVVVRDTVAELRPVTLGEVYGERVEVRSGLTDQDRVVVSGQLNLAPGTRVEVVDRQE